MSQQGYFNSLQCSVQYNTVYLYALKSWRYGQLNLAHGTEKIRKTKNDKNSSGDEIANVLVNDDIAHT